ncbi:hypothetical protein EYF80_044135 [Liparis tanakae]|uniref:Uncharacterized protein n=1 Tax=Liparis tanakae TaxID=230148 RepID=A0A4Z2FYN6_9TELE|nr:hypothetical protein EYF80_044135 [Liparis tanakae]
MSRCPRRAAKCSRVSPDRPKCMPPAVWTAAEPPEEIASSMELSGPSCASFASSLHAPSSMLKAAARTRWVSGRNPGSRVLQAESGKD